MHLDLGCGLFPRDGYEGVDKEALPGVTWQCDLERYPWVFRAANLRPPFWTREEPVPWQEVGPTDFDGTFYGQAHPIGEVPHLPDNIVEGVNCNQLVEHIHDLVGFMSELHRVCKDGAEVHIFHPYQFNVRAWQDPTHVRCLNEVSFFYFDKSWRGDRPDVGDDVDFEVVDLDAIPEENWKEIANEFPEEFERACRNQINVIADLHWVLRCRK